MRSVKLCIKCVFRGLLDLQHLKWTFWYIFSFTKSIKICDLIEISMKSIESWFILHIMKREHFLMTNIRSQYRYAIPYSRSRFHWKLKILKKKTRNACVLIYTEIVKDRFDNAINTVWKSAKIHDSEWVYEGLHIICIGQHEAPCQNGIFISIPKRPKIDFGRAKSRAIANTDRITYCDRTKFPSTRTDFCYGT